MSKESSKRVRHGYAVYCHSAKPAHRSMTVALVFRSPLCTFSVFVILLSPVDLGYSLSNKNCAVSRFICTSVRHNRDSFCNFTNSLSRSPKYGSQGCVLFYVVAGECKSYVPCIDDVHGEYDFTSHHSIWITISNALSVLLEIPPPLPCDI